MESLLPRLRGLDQHRSKRGLLLTCFYSAALLTVIAFYWFFPFPISRTGSVVLMLALPYMIWKFREPGRIAARMDSTPAGGAPSWELAKIDSQIRLFQSAIYYLPFVAGANLFWMGLPGPGTREQKALLDCGFLAATVLIFASVYLLKQRTVRRQLIPLRMELESVLASERALLAASQ